ncbi:Fic/DOC family protein (plasmid) [Butyrivibrio hungatei]|uniref:Fic/DOC family protein n=2 Tax=Butyrivibrio hungatei TaxID=185008 RepID=A0A1D9P5S5_9FIRM|nr:Fic/DOC family protein [Butyrivibrio hungatei]
MPYQTFGGADLFPNIYDKAVRYLFGFATNQVFRDGNKRTAAITMLVFLHFNDIELDISSSELAQVTLDVANKKLTEEQVKQFLIKHTI